MSQPVLAPNSSEQMPDVGLPPKKKESAAEAESENKPVAAGDETEEDQGKPDEDEEVVEVVEEPEIQPKPDKPKRKRSAKNTDQIINRLEKQKCKPPFFVSPRFATVVLTRVCVAAKKRKLAGAHNPPSPSTEPEPSAAAPPPISKKPSPAPVARRKPTRGLAPKKGASKVLY